MYPLSDREKQSLAKADHLNAILSQSSIPNGAIAAQQRAKEQAAQRLQERRNAQRSGELEATLGVRQQIAEADNIAAGQRADTIAGMKREEALRGPMAVLSSLEQFKTDANTYGEGETGTDTALSYVSTYGPEWAGDLAVKGMSEDKQALLARATALDNYVRELVTSGVLSDQDVRNLKPLSLAGTVSPSQITTRANAIQGLVAMKAGINQNGTNADSGGATDGPERMQLPDGRWVVKKRK